MLKFLFAHLIIFLYIYLIIYTYALQLLINIYINQKCMTWGDTLYIVTL